MDDSSKVVIIGGAGFLGRNLASCFSSKNRRVLVLDRPDVDMSYFADRGIAYASCDFLATTGIEEHIDEGDAVIHLVSTSYPNTSNSDVVKDAEENIIATLRLLDVCVRKKAGRVIYASSGGQVYGIPQYTPIDEKHPTEPRSAYGVHKLTTEKYLALYQELYGLRSIVLRISNSYGAGQEPFRGQGVVSTFLASALKDKPVEIWGDGESVRDYVEVGDIAEAFDLALSYEGEHKVFNIGSGEGTSVNRILEIIGETTGKQAQIVRKQAAVEDVHKNILDASLAERELGWKPKTTLREGIERLTKLLKSGTD